MKRRMECMEEALMCLVESQLSHLEDVDAQEMGEVIDMIKDLEEAKYYCAVTKAMEESEEREEYGTRYGDWGWAGNMPPQHMEKDMGHTWNNPKEGKSYHSRRMYMESKEMHQDKTMQMKELEKYAQELTQDIVEMVEDASPEERQYLSKKIAALANKITQVSTGV